MFTKLWQWMVTICSGSKPEMATFLFLAIKKTGPMLMSKTRHVPYQVPSSPESSPALVALAMLEALVPLASHVLPAKQFPNDSSWVNVGSEVRLKDMLNNKIDLGILWFWLSLPTKWNEAASQPQNLGTLSEDACHIVLRLLQSTWASARTLFLQIPKHTIMSYVFLVRSNKHQQTRSTNFLPCASGSEVGLDGARDTGSCWQ